MTPKSVLAVFALLVVVATAGYFHYRQDVVVAPAVVSQAVQPVDVSPPAPVPVSEVADLETDEDETSKEYALDLRGNKIEVETVFGRKVRKDRNCTFRIERYWTQEDGTTTPVLECVPNEPEPLDIYKTYSNKELEALSYSDSRAAYNLALRLRERDYPQAFYYSLRAAALSGDVKGLALMSVHIPHSASKDGKSNLEYYEEQFVISIVARHVDPNSPISSYMPRDAIEQLGGDFDIDALKARIDEHLETIKNIRSEVGID